MKSYARDIFIYIFEILQSLFAFWNFVNGENKSHFLIDNEYTCNTISVRLFEIVG
jgi:hypothetical protein